MPRKSLRERWEAGEIEVATWFERDRSHVMIQEVDTGNDLVSWWDEDVQSLFEDGFFEAGRHLDRSVIDYAEQMGVKAYL